MPCRDKNFEMFKILVMTKFRDRVVNYAQTVREHVGTMREDACQCLTVRAMPQLSQIATDSSRTAHVEFTSSSRAVHEQFRSSSRLMRDSGARIGAWVYTGLPGHCSPFQRSAARRQLISQRQNALHKSRQNGMTCHNKMVAKSHASVSLALGTTENPGVDTCSGNQTPDLLIMMPRLNPLPVDKF